MLKKDLKRIEKMYLQLKTEILKNLLNLENDCEIDISGDMVDELQGAQIAKIQSLLSERDNNKLNNINISLEKMKLGKFGKCEDCGDEIAIKRLEALPGVACCISCAEERERF